MKLTNEKRLFVATAANSFALSSLAQEPCVANAVKIRQYFKTARHSEEIMANDRCLNLPQTPEVLAEIAKDAEHHVELIERFLAGDKAVSPAHILTVRNYLLGLCGKMTDEKLHETFAAFEKWQS